MSSWKSLYIGFVTITIFGVGKIEEISLDSSKNGKIFRR